MKLHRLEPVQIIDKYDGIVLAVVKTNWMHGRYLCSLLAFDPEKRKRVFSLLFLADSEVLDLKTRVNGDWDELLSY